VQRIALVSCVKSKRALPAPAQDLYISPLFRGLRSYAEKNTDRWYILSAKYGLLSPERVVDPYELTLNRMPKADREAWARQVQEQMVAVLPLGARITLLAGSRYREELEPFLRQRGHSVDIPLFGLSMGRQLAWLNRHAAERGLG
jgi:hypothetical protein